MDLPVVLLTRSRILSSGTLVYKSNNSSNFVRPEPSELKKPGFEREDLQSPANLFEKADQDIHKLSYAGGPHFRREACCYYYNISEFFAQ
jgi:hypothetical protein